MNALRDALAAALCDSLWTTDATDIADEVLSDPAFREALEKAVADGIDAAHEADLLFGGPVPAESWDRNTFPAASRAIVDRMLGEEPT